MMSTQASPLACTAQCPACIQGALVAWGRRDETRRGLRLVADMFQLLPECPALGARFSFELVTQTSSPALSPLFFTLLPSFSFPRHQPHDFLSWLAWIQPLQFTPNTSQFSLSSLSLLDTNLATAATLPPSPTCSSKRLQTLIHPTQSLKLPSLR